MLLEMWGTRIFLFRINASRTWETSTMKNIGLDLSFMKDQLVYPWMCLTTLQKVSYCNCLCQMFMDWGNPFKMQVQ